MRILLALTLLIGLTGCVAARVQLDPKWDRGVKYSYEDYFDYYIFGLVGHPTLNLQKICIDQKPYGFVRMKSAEDIVLEVFTIGIYSPRTVRVWCGD